MAEKHYVVTPNLHERQRPVEIPAAPFYLEGDFVTNAKGQTFRITGPCHRQQWGARGANVDVYWRGEEADLDTLPEKMKR